MGRRPRKPRKVSYELIPRLSDIGTPMYALLDELVAAHHDHLGAARIALAWCTSWKPDVDGKVTLGRCRRAGDLDRELAEFDFIILLSRRFWRHPDVTAIQRRALLDHELCHCDTKYDADGEPVEDERGRRVWRTKKHDVEEFAAIVERYGIWRHELETFARALQPVRVGAFTPCEACRESPGWVYTVDDRGRRTVDRCTCWVQWAEAQKAQREELVTV